MFGKPTEELSFHFLLVYFNNNVFTTPRLDEIIRNYDSYDFYSKKYTKRYLRQTYNVDKF